MLPLQGSLEEVCGGFMLRRFRTQLQPEVCGMFKRARSVVRSRPALPLRVRALLDAGRAARIVVIQNFIHVR